MAFSFLLFGCRSVCLVRRSVALSFSWFDRSVTEHIADNTLPNLAKEVAEHGACLSFVLHQWVTLGVGFHAD